MATAAATSAVIFLFGLAIGSFLNVCIRRIPAGMSVVLPASRCPKCQAAIKPYDNIPLISYLVLRGKCRACRAHISPIYPTVELLTALLFVGCFRTFGLTPETAKWMIFCGLIVVLVFTDILERILPDVVNFGGMALGLVFSAFAGLNTLPNDGSTMWLSRHLFGFSLAAPALGVGDALVGAALGSGLLWVVAEGYLRLRGREGMGFGDVKMMAMVGTFLGPKMTLLTILLGSLLGSVLGILLVAFLYFSGWKRKVAERGHRAGRGTVRGLRFALARRYRLPFGTFLGAAALVMVFYGARTLGWYISLFGD